MLTIRDATDGDIDAITALYNREIREGVALWNTRERSTDEMAALIADRRALGHPTLAAVDAAASLLGYGGFGPFRPHDGYRFSVEHSVYVEPRAQGRGVGRALLAALEARARALGLRSMVGAIEAENAASMRLHAAAGFQEVARMPEIGRKFDRWLTLVLMQKRLGDGEPPLSTPR